MLYIPGGEIFELQLLLLLVIKKNYLHGFLISFIANLC